MPVATFDTQAAADALRDAGVAEAQAKATVAMVRDAVTEGVATKTDIEGLKTDHACLEGKIVGMEGNIKILMVLGVAILATVVGSNFA